MLSFCEAKIISLFEKEKTMRYLGIWLLLLAGAEAASIVMVAERLGGMPTLLLMVLSFIFLSFIFYFVKKYLYLQQLNKYTKT